MFCDSMGSCFLWFLHLLFGVRIYWCSIFMVFGEKSKKTKQKITFLLIFFFSFTLSITYGFGGYVSIYVVLMLMKY